VRNKRFIFIPLLLIFLFSPFLALAGSNASNPENKTEKILVVTPKQAWKMIQENRGNPNFVLLDVRTPKEFFKERLAGAIMLDFYSLNFNNELGKLDRNKTYLVYCKTGVKSDSARKVMLKMGFKKVYNMLEGITGWVKYGLPVVKGAP